MKLYAKLTDPRNGWSLDQKRAEALLENIDSETILLVESVAIGRSSTDVTLKDHGKNWNSVQFTFFIEEENGLVEYDIFKNKHGLHKIFNTYMPGWDW